MRALLKIVGLALLIAICAGSAAYLGWDRGVARWSSGYGGSREQVATVFVVTFVSTLAIGLWAERRGGRN